MGGGVRRGFYLGVLLVMFRSVVLPFKALLMNSLSLLGSYGALVVVFQDGFGADLLPFRPLGFVEGSLPIVLYCVLFGLSMDYEVFSCHVSVNHTTRGPIPSPA